MHLNKFFTILSIIGLLYGMPLHATSDENREKSIIRHGDKVLKKETKAEIDSACRMSCSPMRIRCNKVDRGRGACEKEVTRCIDTCKADKYKKIDRILR